MTYKIKLTISGPNTQSWKLKWKGFEQISPLPKTKKTRSTQKSIGTLTESTLKRGKLLKTNLMT